MARQVDDLREWVGERWLGVFVECVRRAAARANTEPARAMFVGFPIDDRLDYASAVSVPKIAAVVKRGHSNEMRSYARNLHRWLDRSRIPEPDMIRETLGALGENWIAGLAHAGYQQHAIYLLHGLYHVGAHDLAIKTARLAFGQPELRGLNCDRTWSIDKNDADRMSSAASRCWPSADEREVPIDPTPPLNRKSYNDLLASHELFAAYSLFDAALHMTLSTPCRQRIYSLKDAVANHVLAWAKEHSSAAPKTARNNRGNAA